MVVGAFGGAISFFFFRRYQSVAVSLRYGVHRGNLGIEDGADESRSGP